MKWTPSLMQGWRGTFMSMLAWSIQTRYSWSLNRTLWMAIPIWRIIMCHYK